MLATVERYEIEGTVALDEDDVPAFRIIDEDAALNVSVDLGNISLEPSGSAEIHMAVDFGSVVGGVAWDQVERDGEGEAGTLLLGPGHPQAGGVASALETAFALVE